MSNHGLPESAGNSGSAYVVKSLAFEGPKSGPDRGYTVKASYLESPPGNALVEIMKDGRPHCGRRGATEHQRL